MPKYIDLLEQRTALKATKEQMFKLGYQKKDLDAIDAKIKKQVDDSVKFAEESPWPKPEEAFEDIYEQKDYPFVME